MDFRATTQVTSISGTFRGYAKKIGVPSISSRAHVCTYLTGDNLCTEKWSCVLYVGGV